MNVKVGFLFIAILSTLSCSESKSKESFLRPRYIMELLDGDNRELYECSLPIKMRKWEKIESSETFFRDQSWRWNDGVTQSEKNERLTNQSDSIKIQQDPQTKIIYIGKWHHVKKIGNDIRVIGYQITDKKRSVYGEIRHQFEFRNEENEKIKEMKFALAVIPKNTHKQDSECAIKWYDKYGYNAIAETERVWARGFWGKLMLKHELIVTGKVIESEE